MSVVVIGMHRSGTSAIAGALGLCGLRLPDERYLLPAQPDNPRGFFENRLLMDVDRRVLEALGGDWSAPAPMPPGWHEDPSLDGLRAEAEETFRETMPEEAWVWKDPRTCLTLPFWLPILGDEPPAVVYIHRDPRRVVRSLERRNGVQPATGTALWERYTRAALENVRGLRVVTVGFEDLLDDPVGAVRRVADDLDALGVPATEPDDDAVRGFLASGGGGPGGDGEPGTGASGSEAGPELSAEQEALLEVVASLEDRYERFPELDLPPATPWTETLLEERRRHLVEHRRLAAERDAATEEHRALAEERRALAQEHQRFRRQLHRERRELMDLRRRHAALRTHHEGQLRSRPMWVRSTGRAYRRSKARTKRFVGRHRRR